MNRNKTLAKSTIILGIGQFIPKIIAIIILPILTKYLTTGEYGTYDLILSFMSLTLPLLTFLIQQGTYRYIINENDFQIKRKIITSSLLFIIFMEAIYLVFTLSICSLFHLNMQFYLLIYLLFVSEAMYDFAGQVSRGLNKNIMFSLGTIIYSVLNMLLLLLAILFANFSLSILLLIVIVSYLLATTFLLICIDVKKYFSLKCYEKLIVKKLLKYSLPIIPSSISLWIVNLSDRLIIRVFLNASMNGIYAVACKIPNLFGVAYNVFNLAWTEVAIKSVNDDDKDIYYSELFSNLYRFLISCVLFLITFSPIIFYLLIDSKFSDGYFQMPLLFLGVLFSSLTSFYGSIYIALEKTKKVGVSSLLGAIINLIIDLLLIKIIGITAASLSTFISFFVIYIYRTIDIKKYLNINYKKKEIFFSIALVICLIFLFYINKFLLLCIGNIVSLIYFFKFNPIVIAFFNNKNLILNKLKK